MPPCGQRRPGCSEQAPQSHARGFPVFRTRSLKWKHKCCIFLGGLLAIILLMVIIDPESSPADPTATPTPTAGISAIGESACTHYYNVDRDWNLGLLTGEEILSKHREILSNTYGADEPLEPHAQAMVAAVIADDVDRYLAAATAFRAACTAARVGR